MFYLKRHFLWQFQVLSLLVETSDAVHLFFCVRARARVRVSHVRVGRRERIRKQEKTRESLRRYVNRNTFGFGGKI